MDGSGDEAKRGSAAWLMAAHAQLACCTASVEGQPATADQAIRALLSALAERFEAAQTFLMGPLGDADPVAMSWVLGTDGVLNRAALRASGSFSEQLGKAAQQLEATAHDSGLLSSLDGGHELRIYCLGNEGEGWLVGVQRGGDAAAIDDIELQCFSSLSSRVVGLAASQLRLAELTTLRSTDAAIWRQAQHGMVLVREDGSCARANAVAAGLLGLSQEEVLQTPPATWLPGPFSLGAAGSVSGTWEGLLASATGLAVPVEIIQSMVAGDGMSLLQLTDRSDVVALEEQLKQLHQHQLMGRLCGGVVHDLNNLLTVIVAALEKAERDMGDQIQPLIFSDGQEAVRRCESLCSQLLTMGQCEPGPTQMVHPDEIIGGMERLLMRAVPEHVEFTLTLGAPDIQIVLPGGGLELILLNLLIGATESLDKGSGVRVTTGRKGDGFLLCLEDNGSGISEGHLHRVFASQGSAGQPVEAATGLAVVHNLVARVGGQFEIKSVPGRGTTYEVSIGLASNEPPTPPPPHSSFDSSIRGDGKTILLCENDPVLRDVMAGTLSKQGYGVLTCADGRRGLAMIESGRTLDAVVTDLVMPIVGGAEVALACNLAGLSTPVVFVSGLLDRDALPEIGAPSEFLAKPFRMNDLLAALQAVLVKVSG